MNVLSTLTNRWPERADRVVQLEATLRGLLLIVASSILNACGGGSEASVAGNSGTTDSGTTDVKALTITSGPPPQGIAGEDYDPVRKCVGGSLGHPCHWEIVGYGFPLRADGGVQQNGVIWSWAPQPGSALPPGLTISGATLTGTPTMQGTYGVVVTARDTGSSSTANASYILTIVNPPPPVISTMPPPQGATLGQPYTFAFSASGPTAITFSATGTLPAGLAAVTPSGVLAGTPTVTGSFPILLRVVDAAGQTVTENFTIEAFAHGFTLIGSLNDYHDPRANHTATLLNTGQVLIAGGADSQAGVQPVQPVAELFDPATRTFSATTASMISPRSMHTATLLCDLSAGPCVNPKVLIAGGFDGTPLASAELFDPTSGNFTATGSMSITRLLHTATLLPGGKVLIVGGSDNYDGSGTLRLAAELFDPTAGTFTATGSLTMPRGCHTATLLATGKVLIVGGTDGSGCSGNPLANAELYDPVAGTFTATGSMTAARSGHSATLLANGQVLIAGGTQVLFAGARNQPGPPLASAEIYDPTTGTFAATTNLLVARQGHTAVLLPTGSVLLAGGFGGVDAGALKHAELFDPTTATFSSTGALQVGRSGQTMTALGVSGQVLVVGGFYAPWYSEVYQ